MQAAVLAGAAALTAASAHAGGRILVAEPEQGVKIRIDGDLREWPAKMTPLSETLEGKATEASAVVGYDDRNLYLALRVADHRVARTPAAHPNEDHATLTIAFPRGHDYASYEVEVYPGAAGRLPAMVKLKGSAVPGAKAVEGPGEKKTLQIEAAIPWSTFPEASKARVGLRASVSYANADVPGAVKSVVSTSSGKSGRALGPLLLEDEQGLETLLRDKGLSDVPAREVYGNLAGDGMWERAAVFGPYLTISGPTFRGGKEFYFSELGVSAANMVTELSLADFDGDGHDELVIRKRVGSAEKYREVLQVMKVGRDDSPFVAFSHEIGVKTADGSIANKVKIADGTITVSQGDAQGFEPDSYSEPLPSDMPPALLPWESIKSQSYKWQGDGFGKAGEETGTPSVTGKSGGKPHKASARRDDDMPAPPAPRPPSSDELLDRVYALYRKERGVGQAKPRFDFVTDVAGDRAPERIVIHDRDLVVFGKGFRKGTSYSFITIGVADGKDILDATARDLTGDGKAEIIVRAVLHAKASKALGGDTVDRHALFVYSIKDDGVVRIFAAETGRSLGKNSILGAVSFTRAARGQRIELGPGRAIGWTEASYPFPPDTTTAGGLEPLALPWNGTRRSYKWNGSAYVAE